MKSPMLALFGVLLFLCLAFVAPCFAAAPPVRIALVAASGSGQEQEVTDRIRNQVEQNPNIIVSTVNPDWFVVVAIADRQDLMAANVRVNGTLTIKTKGGQVINTVSTQANKQDYNTHPGVPQPLNRALVDAAVEQVIQALTERSLNPIQDAVEIEMQTREQIIKAQALAGDGQYGEARNVLSGINEDSPHYRSARDLMAQYQIEQDAVDSMTRAKSSVRAGNLSAAIAQLKGINSKSKLYQPAKGMISQLQRELSLRKGR